MGIRERLSGNEAIVKKKEIDCSGIEVLLRKKFHQLGWVSVYVKHTNLCIEVKESLYDTVEHQGIEYGYRYDLVANKNARIYSVVTRAGKAVVKTGQLVKQGDVLVLGQNEIYDDSGTVKDILLFKADAQILGDVIYDIKIPLSEMEILSLKIAGRDEETALLKIGYRKLQWHLQQLEDNHVIILNIEGFLEKEEKNICFRGKIYAREQIGINIPVEEVLENEFE